MPRPDRLYVDANIFIRLLESNDALALALSSMLTSSSGPPSWLVTSELTLAELLVLPIRNRDATATERYEVLLRSTERLDVAPVDRLTLRSAAAIRAAYRSVKLPDAIHLATALLSGCSHFLTADMRLAGPFALTEISDKPIEIVRPDPSFLRLIDAVR